MVRPCDVRRLQYWEVGLPAVTLRMFKGLVVGVGGRGGAGLSAWLARLSWVAFFWTGGHWVAAWLQVAAEPWKSGLSSRISARF